MKKTAVLLYDSFCTFEISPVLEILALSGKPITVFGISKQAIRSEDGLSVVPDETIESIDIEAYDSLILPGAMDIRKSIENEDLIVIRYYLALRGAENGVTAMVTPFFCVQG